MTGHIHYTPEAKQHRQGIDDWIAENSSADAARRAVEAILDHIDSILEFPHAGRALDDIRSSVHTMTYKKRTLTAYEVDESSDDIAMNIASEAAGKMSYPLVRELAADGIPVAVTCRVLKIARQPYYRWLARPVTDAELIEAYPANTLFDAHLDAPEFGYRFLVDEAHDAGQPMAERTAWRIFSTQGWWSAFGKKRGRTARSPSHRSTTTCAPSWPGTA
ncbi:hypothetical protein GL325_02120 [Aeromicrobium sp. 636]|uniref:Type II toxin-antitoxin system RelE/ParE family toxin n=1 Tax=Aeromicrobium senzhongii TaxID=2663859 RepID=A0A8I0JZV2_9ACTN|nr:MULTISPECIES: type II toxin-antitoxin system RelE/ParE family toxin [Aeromicrobium]MBC9225113.1 type II toxin-antitoxin system RelE/ParE family toxin [Aeromicrobium senzhongii]MCQ3997223.1 hypothetical protein [Aeromicrobium sp. 636]